MTSYVGSKIIKAKLTNLADYKKEKYGDLAIIKEGDNLIEGYIVLYPGIGKNKDNYKSWSPKDVFEKAYREVCPEELEILKL